METEGKGVGGVADKLSTSLLVDPHRIPYVPMNGNNGRRGTYYGNWVNRERALIWIIPLMIFMGITAIVFLVSEQETFVKLDLLSRSQKEELRWNELIFTQLWGYSSCVQFKDKHNHSHKNGVTCRYENLPSFWSIHGIWPTRAGSKGPNFCTKVKFNMTMLDPIRPSLDQYWYEIDSTKDGNYFWSHEWEKHGSCAIEANQFDTELKYFSAGLDLRKEYDLYSILKEKDILPESPDSAQGYSLAQITDAITGSLGPGVEPFVQCLEKKNENGEADFYLLALQLCFNKDLQFVGCRNDRRQPVASKLGDYAMPCPETEPIKYLTL